MAQNFSLIDSCIFVLLSVLCLFSSDVLCHGTDRDLQKELILTLQEKIAFDRVKAVSKHIIDRKFNKIEQNPFV